VAHTRNKKTASNVATTGDLTQLAGSYDFGVARLVGQFSDGNNGVAGAGERDYNAHQIGVVVPFGATEFFAISGRAKTKDNVGVKTESLKLAQVGVKYSLSKRTTLFAVTGTTKDDVAAAGSAGTAYKGTSTRLGVAHTF
jgi:predicted porin